MNVTIESRGKASVAWLKGTKHTFYEDRYRILSKDIPLVGGQDRGELFAVFDGIGSAPKGRQAAQAMADIMIEFYQDLAAYPPSPEGVGSLFYRGNKAIHEWGFIGETDVPLGGCAGTVAWIYEGSLYVFHAGDTTALHINNRGQPSLLTRDHQMENGAIYRYFGLGPNLEIETDQVSLEELDRVLLLTDGVTKVIHPLEAAGIVKSHDDIGLAAKTVAQRAFQKGSIDDITVLLIEIEDF
jgi:PPM family protein phosphatase